jgi:hypothetical protein
MKEWASNQRQPAATVEQQMDRRGVCGWRRSEEVGSSTKAGPKRGMWVEEVGGGWKQHQSGK